MIILLFFILLLIKVSPSISKKYKCLSDDDDYPSQRSEISLMPMSNGCSKPSFLQIEGEEDFTSCCDLHDACYATCLMSKNECDKDFDKCMKKMCNSNFKSRKNSCEQAADMYTMGVNMFGVQGYHESQNEYCSCVNKNDVIDHYKKLFHEFYITYTNKDSYNATILIDRILNIDDDSEDTDKIFRKTKRTFYNLIKKYPNAIRYSGERAHLTPPPIMNKDEL